MSGCQKTAQCYLCSLIGSASTRVHAESTFVQVIIASWFPAGQAVYSAYIRLFDMQREPFFQHDLCAESEVHGPGRQRAEEGQWFRLHGQGKTASQTDAGIVKMALAVLDADVRRTMYQQPLLSQDKFTGMPLPSILSSGCS